ncbi:PREDICTED: transmembrane 4 L6 family member 19 [Tauraco erythrolophus]|uniref:transmembrane 4 L6 family member 19 n=1 Tax=Tauraco erythrolophus TaxID=121530 RepID=UPI0005239156|nr:PREDICTED: transmembrane 4 L6 family member 19 [Tauraco erythrolophus]
MCVGKCSRIVGPCLLALGTLSVAANILLLFPGGTAKYLVEGHISKDAKVMAGVWGGGITLLGAAACFVLSGVGLTNGPLCFYNASEHGRGHGTLWGYPFLDSPSHRAENYLYDRSAWSICLEPAGVVAWNAPPPA